MTAYEYNNLPEYDKAVLLAQNSKLVQETEDDRYGYGIYLIGNFHVNVTIDKYNPLHVVYTAV